MLKLIVFFYFCSQSIAISAISDNILYRKNDFVNDLQQLLSKLLNNAVRCVSFIYDDVYSDVFDDQLFSFDKQITFFSVKVRTNENLAEPTNRTLSMLYAIGDETCSFYVILLANGFQTARFFYQIDKLRALPSESKFITWYDRRLFADNLNYLWKTWINIVFIKYYHVNSFSNWYELSTVPFPEPIGSEFVAKSIDTWTRGHFRYNRDVFYDKTSNLRNQTLNVAVFVHEPAVKRIERNDDVTYAGVEIEILKILGSKINFRLNITEVPNNGDFWGKPLASGGYSGLLGVLNQGHIDVAVGDLYYQLDDLKILDLSIPYNTECLTFLTPESLRDFSHKTLILPFRLDLWLATVAVMFLIGIIFHFINKTFEDIHGHKLQNNSGLDLFRNFNSVLYSFGMTMNVCVPRMPHVNWSLRILIGFYWFYCFWLTVMYKASMTAILAEPIIRITIDTVTELIESGIGYGGQTDIVKDFFLLQNDTMYQEIGTQFEILNGSVEGVNKVKDGNFAFLESANYLKHILANHDEARDANNQQLHIMESCIVSIPISIGFKRNSPLKPILDHHIRRIIQSGLINKWIKDFGNPRNAKNQHDRESVQDRTTDQAVMNFRKFVMVIVWFVTGLTVATAVFVIEIVYWHRAVKTRPNFDPYRLDDYYSSNEFKTWFDVVL